MPPICPKLALLSYLALIWRLSGAYLALIWRLSGAYLALIWRLSGAYGVFTTTLKARLRKALFLDAFGVER
jgi:hypothetical protein